MDALFFVRQKLKSEVLRRP